MFKITSTSSEQTISLGAKLAHFVQNGDLVALIGMLGAGKTYFTKGIAKGLGVPKSQPITSPSFVLGNLYKGKKAALYHFDAYRIDNPREIFRLGLEEVYAGSTVTVLEWADKFLPLLQKESGATRIIKVRFKVAGKNKRLLTFSFGRKSVESRFRAYLKKDND